MDRWSYDEFKHCGVDYSKAEMAEKYEERHRKFRDFGKEFSGMMDFLELGSTGCMTAIDLGCGTGVFSMLASVKFSKVIAVDVSDAMLSHARSKARLANTGNVEFVNAGFLTYVHSGDPADLVMTKAALHHLPDFWKQIALLNMNRMLKDNGLLYIHDIVFNFRPAEHAEMICGWIAGFEKIAGAEFARELETHVRDEFSTYAWILEGMIERAGFKIEKHRSNDGFLTEYACRKCSPA